MTYPVDQTKYKTLVMASGLKYLFMCVSVCVVINILVFNIISKLYLC